MMIALVYAVFKSKELRPIAHAILYLFLSQALYLGGPGTWPSLDVWYTAPHDCIPNGPAFGATFYLTVIGVSKSLAALWAVAMYNQYVKCWPIRKAFWVTTLMKIVASSSDLFLVYGWNRALHVPDALAYHLGSVVFAVADAMNQMPKMFMIPKLCPPGMESTITAILISTSNFGMTMGSLLGGSLMDEMGVDIHDLKGKMSGVACNDESLGTALIFGHIALPLLSIPITFFLIPDERVDVEVATQQSNAGGSSSLGAALISFIDDVETTTTFAAARRAYQRTHSLDSVPARRATA